jgi:hypothetical protein
MDNRVVTRYALGAALALTIGGAAAMDAQQQVPVRKDSRVVQEDRGMVEIQATRADLRAEMATLDVGATTRVTADVYGPNDQRIYERRITWRSENPEIARVDADGQVTAVSPGTATIVGEVDGQTARTTITVRGEADMPARVSRVELRSDMQTLNVGETTRVHADVHGAEGQMIYDREIMWRSENPEIARVSQDGEVTAVSPGTATIVGEVDGQTARTTIVVEPEPQPFPLTRRGAFYWGIAGGANFPQGALSDGYDRGWNVTMPIGWDPVDNPWGARLDLSWNRLEGRTFAAGVTQLETNPATVWSAMVNGTLRLPIMQSEGRSGPYAIGGVGVHHFRNFAFTGAGDGDLIFDPEDPEFGTWEERSTTRFGANVGAGFAFGLGAASLFVESRYVTVFMPNRNANYVPLILGVTF